MIRTYSELSKLKTFEERFEYLKIGGGVGYETFGFDRYLNQIFYTSPEWRQFRNRIIARDNGCDLGIDNRPIYGNRQLIIHHMNPVKKEQIVERDPDLMNPEYVITVKRNPTHQAIHYGDSSLLENFTIIERKPNDTCPWRR